MFHAELLLSSYRFFTVHQAWRALHPRTDADLERLWPEGSMAAVTLEDLEDPYFSLTQPKQAEPQVGSRVDDQFKTCHLTSDHSCLQQKTMGCYGMLSTTSRRWMGRRKLTF